MNGNARPVIDYTAKDYSSLREAMLALAREKLPAWTDHSPNDLGVLLVELFAYLGDIQLYYQDRIANESYLDSAVERRSILNLLRLIGCELRPPRPASADLTLLFDEAATGNVTLATDTVFQTSAKATGKPIDFRYVRDPVTIALDGLPLITHSDGRRYRRYRTLPVVQVDEAVTGEIVGSSDGSAGQRFPLARSPLIDGSLTLWVDEGVGRKQWQQQDSLLHSLSNHEHFVIRRDEKGIAWIEFGDGEHGKIPRRGHNTLTADYRVGGESKGNVPPYTIAKAVTPIAQLGLVFNELAAAGGSDAESSAEAMRRGPQAFRSMGRAVTVADYEQHAREFGVGKARARAAGWNRVELFVAPVGGGQPSDTFKEDLRLYFEDKRLMTTILEVKDPRYVTVTIEGELEINPYFFTDQVRQQSEDAVRALLAFENVDFEGKLHLSKLYEAVEGIDGVAGVYISRFAKSGSTDALPPDGILDFGWNEIPRAGVSDVNLSVP